MLKWDIPPLGGSVEAHHLEQIGRLGTVQYGRQLSTAARVSAFAMLFKTVTEGKDKLLLLVERYTRENRKRGFSIAGEHDRLSLDLFAFQGLYEAHFALRLLGRVRKAGHFAVAVVQYGRAVRQFAVGQLRIDAGERACSISKAILIDCWRVVGKRDKKRLETDRF